MTPRPAGWARLVLAVGLVCVAAGLVATSDTVHSALIHLLDAADGVIARHPVGGALLFVALAAASAMLAFFSSAVIVPVAVYAWGEPLAALLLWTGWMLGGCAAYGAARLFGRPVVAALTSEGALARFDERVSRHASIGAVLLLQLAVPSEVPGYVLGLAHWGLWRYLLVLAIAELPYAVATVLLGSAFLERRFAVVVALGAAALAVGVLALRLARR